MTTFRQVKDGTIVNRIVADEIPSDYLDAETYEPETENPPPQIGWSRTGSGQPFTPPPQVEQLVSIVDPRDARIAELESRLAALESK